MLPKSVKSASVEDLKAENPALYESMLALGRTERDTEVVKLTAEVATLKRQSLIQSAAAKMGLITIGEELLKKDASLEEALTVLSEAKQENSSGDSNNLKLKGILEQTAPQAAGQDSSGDHSVDKVDTVEKAYKAVTKEGMSKRDVAMAARKQFPEIFSKLAK